MRSAPVFRRASGALFCLLAIGLVPWRRPSVLSAQGSELSVEVGGSIIEPPAGVEGDAARFLSAGLRAMRYSATGSGIFASFLAGRTLNGTTGGDFYSLNLEGVAWWKLTGGWSAGMEVEGFGFDVGEPFPYRALGFEGGPSFRFASRHVAAEVAGVAGAGWSRSELVRYADGAPTTVEDDLWRYGATAEVLAGSSRIMGGVSAGIHEGVGGTYRSGGLRLLAGWGGPALEVRVDYWRTPAGNETTGGLAFILPLDGWSFRGFLGRTEPDPLTLAEPGGGAGGLLLGKRLLGRDPLPPAKPPLHEVLEQREGGATVQIRVQPPGGIRQVEILGDFTFWEPVEMRRDGDAWVVELEIPEGAHHFGFLVDGAWFLPEDAPDAVPDEWGRRNATLVVER
jgi:hypothetical protein